MRFLLLLSALGLCWAQYSPHTQDGRTSMVHLFEWRWVDIAKECERYLGPKGFGGVQVSPPNENIVVHNPSRPWWERYQPISYKICTRSGNEDEFRDMVTRCNNVGVRIYVDAVVNHMCGAGGGEGTSSTCGSYYNAHKEDFPAVPYSGWDFNDGKCHTSNGEVQNYNDANQVRNCRVTGLLDLALEKDYVRTKVADYLNHLIDIGVAGFRLDAAKHMWPGDIKAFLNKLHNLNTKWFSAGSKPFIYQEVIDLGGEAISSSEYFGNGRVTEFKYGAKLGTVIRKWNGEKMAYLKNWGEGWGLMPSDRALVFIDNHDNQRGHGAGGASILTFWDARLYKMGVGFMLAHPYGFTRVMSSYRWDRNFQNGKSKNSWSQPRNEKGLKRSSASSHFTVLNLRIIMSVYFFRALSTTLQTGLPAGTYCDVISGDKIDGNCTGIKIQVSGDGRAHFSISNSAEDPFIAIHAESKL
uniref:Alpha-amylase n=1 Tax=Jaculus jaculus TaxID=51337 RepID=A0A8C5LAX4_JACJA